MADISLTAAPILDVDRDIGGNRIRERSDLALVSAAIPLGGDDAFVSALEAQGGPKMPDHRHTTTSGEMRAIRTAPDQIMLMFPHETPDANDVIRNAFGDAAYTTDQTDAWVILEVSGPDTLAALERICPIDLHEDAFPDGAFARTMMEHMGAMILRLERERFLLLSASSSARSFLHAVETSFDNVTAA